MSQYIETARREAHARRERAIEAAVAAGVSRREAEWIWDWASGPASAAVYSHHPDGPRAATTAVAAMETTDGEEALRERAAEGPGGYHRTAYRAACGLHPESPSEDA